MSTATTMPAPSGLPTLNITDRTVAINLTIGRPGNSKKVSKSQISEKTENSTITQDAAVEVDADKDLVGVSKKLLKSKELQAIVKHDAESADWVKARSVPSMFKKGIHLVKIQAVQQIEDYLLEAQRVRKEVLIPAFLAVYDQQRQEAEQHLRGIYNAADYPPRGVVAASFVFEWQYITFATPGKLKEISADFFEREKAKAAEKWSQATEQAKILLRVQMKDLVDHLVERMTPGDDGKRKVFKKTTVSNISEFLANFSLRNVTDDAEMDFLVGQAKKLLDGVDPEQLRKSEVDAECLQKGFSTVKTFLDAMVEDAGSRKIVFDQEEEEEEASNPFA